MSVLRVELREGLLRDECTVTSIRKSLIPGIVIVSLDCQGSKVEFDVLKELLVVSEGSKTEYTLSMEKPEYVEKKEYREAIIYMLMEAYHLTREEVLKLTPDEVKEMVSKIEYT